MVGSEGTSGGNAGIGECSPASNGEVAVLDGSGEESIAGLEVEARGDTGPGNPSGVWRGVGVAVAARSGKVPCAESTGTLEGAARGTASVMEVPFTLFFSSFCWE